ncbi:T-DNA transfer exported protein (virB3) (plasmid) [Agrobacterium tumefaciens]|nr:T-DNA transfer exported protein (virB3) [Agrobacterium tumefaciens]
MQTAGRSVDGLIWGGASVSPNPIKVPARGRGMA